LRDRTYEWGEIKVVAHAQPNTIARPISMVDGYAMEVTEKKKVKMLI
jgi:hypothetical protein